LRYVEKKYGVNPLIDVEPKHARVAVSLLGRVPSVNLDASNSLTVKLDQMIQRPSATNLVSREISPRNFVRSFL